MHDGKGIDLFVVSLDYKVDLNTIDDLLPAHVQWLHRHYESGAFVASGPKFPRTGGIIIVRHMDRGQLEEILNSDPFAQKDFANYDIIEFEAKMTCKELSSLT